MTPTNRREFLRDVSCGMLVAGLGTSLAADLGFGTTAFAAELPAGQPNAVQLVRYVRAVLAAARAS